ncbi:MAG: hypothetical protein ACFFCM_07940 [Promethearchaeota archaeon]
MSRLTYGFEFSLKKLMGVSILDNPMEVFGLIIVIILEVVIALLIYRAFTSYRETKMFSTMLWLLAFSFIFVGVIFLILEKVAYSTLGNIGLGDLMTILALITSGAGIVCFDMFSFHTAYPDYEKGLSVIVSSLAAIYIGALSFAIATGSPNSEIINNEPVYSLGFDIIAYLTLVPLLAIAPFVFLFFYWRNRDRERGPALRGLWIGIAFLFFAFGYISEAAPYFPADLAIPLRVFHLIAASLLYICLTMPDWFKNRIGWTD